MTDHKHEAELALVNAGHDVSENFVLQTGEHKADVLALAQVHATLYLAEQQRIANIIAYWQLHTPRSIADSETGMFIEVHQIEGTDDQSVDDLIRESLGLS